MKKLPIGADANGSPVFLPLDIVTEKLAFLGRTGSGKTYSASKLAELMLDAGAQIIALDPVGVWRGLRMGGNLEIYIFGGQSGDFPLESTGGSLVADLVVDRGISAVLDVSQFGTDTEHRRFAFDFATRFFHLKKTRPSAVHVFIEEAQEFIPQDKQHGDERMLHAFQRLWKLGRNFGIGGSIISQRPQDVNKKALNMSGTLFVHQMTAPGDRDVISRWVDEKGIDADVGAILPKIKVGQPHVWSPDFLKISEGVAIGAKKTADISSTPKVGSAAKAQAITPIDADKISKDMAATIERAKENDPAHLKAELSKLRGELGKCQAELAKKPVAGPAPAPQRFEVPILSDADRRLIEKAISVADGFPHEFQRAAANMAGVRTELQSLLQRVTAATSAKCVITPQMRTMSMRSNPNVPPPSRDPEHHTILENAPLAKADRAILQAIAQRHPRPTSKSQAAILSGYSVTSSTFSNALSSLRVAGYIEGSGDNIRITDAGMAVAGPITRPHSPDEVQAYWLNRLGKSERAILQLAITAYPNAVPREQIAQESGYSVTSSTFSNALSQLRVLELITRERDVRATENLFPQ